MSKMDPKNRSVASVTLNDPNDLKEKEDKKDKKVEDDPVDVLNYFWSRKLEIILILLSWVMIFVAVKIFQSGVIELFPANIQTSAVIFSRAAFWALTVIAGCYYVILILEEKTTWDLMLRWLKWAGILLAVMIMFLPFVQVGKNYVQATETPPPPREVGWMTISVSTTPVKVVRVYNGDIMRYKSSAGFWVKEESGYKAFHNPSAKPEEIRRFPFDNLPQKGSMVEVYSDQNFDLQFQITRES